MHPGKEILETGKSGRLSSRARKVRSARSKTTSSNPEIVCPNEEAKMDFKIRWLKYKNFKRWGKAPKEQLHQAGNSILFCTYDKPDVCQIVDGPERNQVQKQHE